MRSAVARGRSRARWPSASVSLGWRGGLRLRAVDRARVGRRPLFRSHSTPLFLTLSIVHRPPSTQTHTLHENPPAAICVRSFCERFWGRIARYRLKRGKLTCKYDRAISGMKMCWQWMYLSLYRSVDVRDVTYLCLYLQQTYVT